MARETSPEVLVLDTNIALDVFVFQDPAADALRSAMEAGHTRWIATDAMRDELQRVLDYPHIARRLREAGNAVSVIAPLEPKTDAARDAR